MKSRPRILAAVALVVVIFSAVAVAVLGWLTPPSCADVDVLDTGVCTPALEETGVHVDELRREWR